MADVLGCFFPVESRFKLESPLAVILKNRILYKVKCCK